MSGIQGAFLSIGDRFDTFFIQAEINQVFHGCIGASLAKGQVVFNGTPLITMPFDDQAVIFIAV